MTATLSNRNHCEFNIVNESEVTIGNDDNSTSTLTAQSEASESEATPTTRPNGKRPSFWTALRLAFAGAAF